MTGISKYRGIKIWNF